MQQGSVQGICLFLTLFTPLCGDLFFEDQKEFLLATVPFLCSNERNKESLFSLLKNFPCAPWSAYVGFSVEMNYAIFLERKTESAFLCDNNPRVIEFFEKVKFFVERSETVDLFLRGLKECLEQEKGYFFRKRNKKENLQKCLIFFKNLLEQEGNFAFLKTKYKENKIHHVFIDVQDTRGRFQELANCLKDKGCLVDTLYLSNIFYCIKDKEQMKKNISLLKNRHTLTIEASERLFLEIIF